MTSARLQTRLIGIKGKESMQVSFELKCTTLLHSFAFNMKQMHPRSQVPCLILFHPCEPTQMPLVWFSLSNRASACPPLPVSAAFIRVLSRHRARQRRLDTIIASEPLTVFQLCELFYPIKLWYKHQQRRGLCSVQMHRAVLCKALVYKGGSAASNFALPWCMRAAVWSASIKFS